MLCITSRNEFVLKLSNSNFSSMIIKIESLFMCSMLSAWDVTDWDREMEHLSSTGEARDAKVTITL